MAIMSKRSGFTLLEISIVLTIIALLIGTITVGKNMLRAAKLNAVIAEEARYVRAFQDFSDKYHSLPGDMPNATSFWGTDSGGCPAAWTTTPHVATCNGNGNGQIESGTEIFRAWQQLADAGMISGSYNGISAITVASPGVNTPVGINVPASQLNGAGWTIVYAGNALPSPLSSWSSWTALYNHILLFGKQWFNSNFAYDVYTYGIVLTPTEAMSIDSKVDDGIPGLGNVMAVIQSATTGPVVNCTTSTTQATAQYNTSVVGEACSLIFITGF